MIIEIFCTLQPKITKLYQVLIIIHDVWHKIYKPMGNSN